MKNLVTDYVPRWYELSSEEYGEKPAITLSIHKDVLKTLSTVPRSLPFVESRMKAFGFKKFRGTFKGDFGFDGVLRRQGKARKTPYGAFADFKARLPQVRGNGKEAASDWKEVQAVSLSFALLLRMIQNPKVTTLSRARQLMLINLAAKETDKGWAVYGILGIRAVKFFWGTKSERFIHRLILGLASVHEHMLGTHAVWCGDAVTNLEKWIFDCAGSSKPAGYIFSPKCPIQTPANQLIVLHALARLHGFIDQQE